MSGTEKALKLLKTLPRVTLGNLKQLPERKAFFKHTKKRTSRGRASKGQHGRNTLPRLGFEGGSTPFYLAMPAEEYYHGHHLKRQYPPISLLQLQRLIDLGWINTDEPIDLTTLSNCPVKRCDIKARHYGINLTDEGADIFDAQVNIEVQWASELTIAAIEKNGGIITNKYYDLKCVEAMVNPVAFFKKGIPIPRNRLPPKDAAEYYIDAETRGYLASPAKLNECRLELAQKYGYQLPDIQASPKYEMLMKRKDPRQIWYGLEPGWAVNLKDKTILKPTSNNLRKYYTQ